MLRNSFRFAAVPSDVRKGCAFPSGFSKDLEAMPRFAAKVRRSLKNFEHITERHSLSAHRRAKPEEIHFTLASVI